MSAITATCPRCGDPVEDLDGFGVLAHDGCGYCSHPSRYAGTCLICGDTEQRTSITFRPWKRALFDSRRVATRRPRG